MTLRLLSIQQRLLAVLITLTSGRRNKFLDCQKAKVRIAVLPIMDVKTRWNSTLELLERAYRLRDFTREWLKYPEHSDYRPLFTTEDEWIVVKYVMEVLRPFRYWTLWMSKRRTVTLHHVITLYNDMFDHMDGVMRALAKKKTPWKEDLYFAVKFAREKLTKYYTEVTPETGILLIAAQILDPFRKLHSFRKWDKGMDIRPDDEESFTVQYKNAFLKYVEEQYCTKNAPMPVIKMETPSIPGELTSTPRTGPGQFAYDPFELSSDDEYTGSSTSQNPTPGRSNRTARLLTATRLYLNSPPERPHQCGQVNPHLDDYLSDPTEVSSAFWTPDITSWWREQEETHSMFADLANVARDIFSIMPHGVGVEASFCLGRDILGWRQSKTTAESLREKVVVRQYARANNGVLAGDYSKINPVSIENNVDIKTAQEEVKLHKMVKTHDFLEMWDGSQRLRATQKAVRSQNTQMTALGYISDTEECGERISTDLADDGEVAFRSYVECAPPKTLPLSSLINGKTKVLKLHRIRRVDRLSTQTDDESAPEDATEAEEWLNWNGDVEEAVEDQTTNDLADEESEDDLIMCVRTKEPQVRSVIDAAPNVLGVVRPTRKSRRLAELAVLPSSTSNKTHSHRGKR